MAVIRATLPLRRSNDAILVGVWAEARSRVATARRQARDQSVPQSGLSNMSMPNSQNRP